MRSAAGRDDRKRLDASPHRRLGLCAQQAIERGETVLVGVNKFTESAGNRSHSLQRRRTH